MTILRFPQRAVQAPAVEVKIDRHRIADALDWQQAIIAEARRYPGGSPALVRWLRETGLLAQCSYFSTDPEGGPLRFRFIGRPALDTLGEAWGRMMLGRPENEDPHDIFAAAISHQYLEAIDGGGAVYNEIAVTGIGQPFSFTHALIGWQIGARRAVLSAVKMHDVAGPRLHRPVGTASDAA
ncbi:hypothetical protein GAY33_01095 [Azospirillum brasilense]|uniref:hypothetical protein n=1 Tax=Azospirillum argentinense TaxID=2970906 RepID=UPI00190BBB69|nr:hypothetical protein [Azospirillum argentinense]MBK3797850.1 hypothetical protein [Azospirillum argentinense]